ncbi:MAG: hypothetical protein WCB99_08190 [Candidatus Cybelea sp.]
MPQSSNDCAESTTRNYLHEDYPSAIDTEVTAIGNNELIAAFLPE